MMKLSLCLAALILAFMLYDACNHMVSHRILIRNPAALADLIRS